MFLQKMIMIGGFILLGLLAFLLFNAWRNLKKTQNELPEIGVFMQEIDDLDHSLQEMDIILKDKDMELADKDRLLEEKNIQLAFMMDKLAKMEKARLVEANEAALLKTQLSKARKQIHTAYSDLEAERGAAGLVFRIQIGVLEGHTLPPMPFSANAFTIEETDGYQKYLVGSFRKYEESLEFRNALRELGLTDAWIVPFIDGKRVKVEEALAFEGEKH